MLELVQGPVNPKYVGRAEPEVKQILERLMPDAKIYQQVMMKYLVNLADIAYLETQTQEHKFDLVVVRQYDALVIEVNYEHGTKAYKKWDDVYVRYLKASRRYKMIPVRIDDNECVHLFKHLKGSFEPIIPQDVIDVMEALKTAGVKILGY